VLVPRRADPERDRIWEWVRRFWSFQVCLPIFEGWHDAGEGPFNRAAALNRAGEAAGGWETAVVIDADVILDPRLVRGALEMSGRAGGAPVLGYTERCHLTRQGTDQILRRDPRGIDLRLTGRTWGRWIRGRLRNSCSGCYVVGREVWEAVGGFDERFSGWGYEDIAFRVATETVSGARLAQISGALFHFWHTVSDGNQPGSATMAANKARCDRYLAAHWDRAAMAAVLAGAESGLDATG
jgi:hypothetical protein